VKGLRDRMVEIVVRPYGGHPPPFDADRAGGYVEALLAGLGMLGRCTVTVSPDERRYDALRPVHVSIEGTECALGVGDAGALAGIVCANRALLVTPRFSRDCRRAWATGDELAFTDAPNAFLHELLTRLVARGFSINRARTWLQWHDPDEATTPEAAFEEAAAFGDPLPVQTTGDPDALRRRLAAAHGIAAAVVSGDRPRLNDLVLPDDGWIERSLGCLVTTTTAGAIVSRLAERHPLLEQEVARRYDRPAVTRILRALADERVPIGDARRILETLASVNLHLRPGREERYIVIAPETATVCRTAGRPATRELCGSVRVALGRSLVPGGELNAVLLDPALEESIASSLPERHDRRRVEQALADALGGRTDAVLLVSAAARPAVAELFAAGFPDLPVLAYQELPPDVSIDAVGRVEEPEPSFIEDALRERLEEIDRPFEEAMSEDAGEAESGLDRSLLGLLEMTVYVKRREARVELLEAAVTEEERDYLSAEIGFLDAAIAETEPSEGGSDAADLLSDFFDSQG
jgi:Fe2+ transport system protein FeoA